MRLVALLSVLALLQDEANLRRLIPGASDISARRAKLTEEQAAGLDAPDVPREFGFLEADVELSFPEPGRYRLRYVEVAAGEGVCLGVAAVPERNLVLAVGVLEGPQELSGFVEQFRMMQYSERALFGKVSDLRAKREKAREAADEEGRRYRALLEVHEVMEEMGEEFGKLGRRVRGEDAQAAGVAAQMRALFGRVEKAAPDALFLPESHRERFRSLAAAAARQMQDMESLLVAKDFAEAKKRLGTMGMRLCGTCHGAFQRRFEEKRDEDGLGYGYFEPGFDVQMAAGTDRALQERSARAVRLGLMLLEKSQ